ncbi:hypothetical protein CHU98_g12182 [Xylaria longipes]|nr:hypothetical protein CHU98_g12182 [Xylaria longipes]
MSSPNKSALPIKPPLNATNSWVISRARELIGYDSYGTIEHWFNNVGEIENNTISTDDNKYDTSKSPDQNHGSNRHGHPAGELKDYDPDCTLFSQKTIAEVLEAAAAETEAENQLALSCYGYFPSDSLERETLLEQFQTQDSRDANSRSTADEKSNAGLGDAVDSPISFLGPDAFPFPSSSSTLDTALAPGTSAGENESSENEVRSKRTLAETRASANNALSPPSISRSSSEFLTVPPPAYTATARARARARAEKHPHPRPRPRIHSQEYTFTQPLSHPEIERCISPMPRFRGEAPYPVSPDSEAPATPGPSVASTSPRHSAFKMQDIEDVPPRFGVNVSYSGRGRAQPDITRPVPQQRGQLVVPQAGRGFRVSPFAGRRRCRGEVPVLTVDNETGTGVAR